MIHDSREFIGILADGALRAVCAAMIVLAMMTAGYAALMEVIP